MSDSGKYSVVLRDEQNGVSNFLSASVKDSWDLELSGQIIGPAGEETLGGGEYEFWRTVRAEHVPKVLLELMKETFKSDADFREWLEAKGIPSELHNWF